MSRSHQTIQVLAGLLILAALYLAGLGTRQVVLESQFDQYGAELPFTLESALHYRRVLELAETGTLRTFDRDVFYPHGVNVRETYTVFSEYLEAGLASVLPDSMSFQRRVRWIESGWFCLGIPLLALWVFGLTGSPLAGAVSAAFYAFTLSSVMRSTGQELSRENIALPLLIAHYAAATWATRSRQVWMQWGGGALAALALALSLIAWDMTQFAIGLWIVFSAIRVWIGPEFSVAERRVGGLCFLGLVIAGIANPYLRAHSFAFGPLMLLGWGVLAASVMPGRQRASIRFLLLMAPVLLGWLLSSGFQESYGHFGELLVAKIRFLNRKPLDPALLTFNQRVMWVPALHSANIGLTFTLFPAILVLSLAGLPVLLRQSRQPLEPETYRLIGYGIVSLITYWFFVRFHVFLSIYLCAWLGVVAAATLRRRGWIKGIWLGGLVAGVVLEAGQVLTNPVQWGRSGVYYQEVAELTDWLREQVRPEPVLANFGTSASILADADCPILLHPKFETQAVRDRFKEYATELFTGTEKSFRDFADREGAGYYVYGKGEFYRQAPAIYQMRYLANALDPPATVPARLFEDGARPLNYFELEWENRKYKVYRIRTQSDEFEARALAHSARRALQRGDLDAAEDAALRSLALSPMNAEALDVEDRVIRLREAGFSYEVPPEAP